MKKLFVVLLSSAALVACSDSGTGGSDTYDSTTSGAASSTPSGVTSGSTDPGTMTGNASTNYPHTGGAVPGMLGDTNQATGAAQSGTVSPTPPATTQDTTTDINTPDAGAITNR